jgi:hypothetical protein
MPISWNYQYATTTVSITLIPIGGSSTSFINLQKGSRSINHPHWNSCFGTAAQQTGVFRQNTMVLFSNQL